MGDQGPWPKLPTVQLIRPLTPLKRALLHTTNQHGWERGCHFSTTPSQPCTSFCFVGFVCPSSLVPQGRAAFHMCFVRIGGRLSSAGNRTLEMTRIRPWPECWRSLWRRHGSILEPLATRVEFLQTFLLFRIYLSCIL